MNFLHTDLAGVVIIEPQVHRDDRGFFFENYQREKFREGGVTLDFVQDNHSRSTKGTLRGLHLQLSKPQGKLVRAVRGEVFDVVVDVRIGSPTFKKWISVNLSENNFRMLYVPPGYAHGFFVLSEVADVEYKCTAYYDKSDEAGVLWSDPSIGVQWPLSGAAPLLSPKDVRWPLLDEVAAQFARHPSYRV